MTAVPDASKDQYTLDTLRRRVVESDQHYLNFVKYYNVEADVMLLAAAREGDRVLTGIRHAVARGGECGSVTAVTAVEARALRTAVRAFQHFFDGLLAAIGEKKRIDLRERPRAKTFCERADRVARLLQDVDGGERLRREACEGVRRILGPVRDARVGAADPPTGREPFEKYYFADPVLNVAELYDLNADDGR